MTTFACPVALLALLGTLGAQAVNVPLASPAPGSAARQAILNAVRGPVERSFGGQHVMFKVNDLQVGGGWAFLAARPMTPAQRPTRTVCSSSLTAASSKSCATPPSKRSCR